jgi:hypothetical protein
LFRVDRLKGTEPHEFAVVHPTGDGLVAALAREYRRLRTESVVEPDESFFAGLGFETGSLQGRLTRALVPRRRADNFDVVRSDLGELLLAQLCADLYETKYGYRSIRDRELTDSQGRGIDLIGVEIGSPRDPECIVTLVLGEAKVSREAASPPQVVDTAKDSLRNQHRGHLEDLQATARKVHDAGRRCKQANILSLMWAAAAILEDGIDRRVRLVAASLLVRPRSCATNADFGSFLVKPADFDPAEVRFLTVRLASDIESAVREFHRLATQDEGEDHDGLAP